MIKVEKLSKAFNNNLVLSDVNFIIQHGKLAVLYGLNGSGKTTMIKCIVGLLNGGNANIELVPNAKSEIGLYLGHEMLIDKLTVYEYLFLSATLKGIPKSAIDEKIIEMANNLQYQNYLNQYISKLSFGTKSKVLFSAAIINEPKVLIMDEPFIGVDLLTINGLITTLSDLKSKGCTILISSHQVDVLEKIIDKILIIKNKKIVLDKSMEDLELKDKNNLSDLIINYLK